MAVFYKYQYTNKRKNIHPCFSCLIASLRCTEFNTHKLNQSALSVRPVDNTYISYATISHLTFIIIVAEAMLIARAGLGLVRSQMHGICLSRCVFN